MKTIHFYLANKKCYNFSDLGSGKTKSTLWYADMLLEAEKIKKVLIICPLSIMKSVWVEEILETVPNRRYIIVHGTRVKRLNALGKDAHFYITNTDAVRNYCEAFLKAKFDLIIIDEVDSFKNARSQRSKMAQLLTANAKSVIGISATPMANSPIDAFGIAKCINPVMLPTRYITKWRAMTMIQYGPHIWEPNYQAEHIVHGALQPAIRFEIKDCIDLPDISYEYREFEMTKDQTKVYKQMYMDQIAEYNEGTIVASTAAVKFTKLLQIASGCVYDEEGNVIVLPIKDKIEEILHIQKQVGQIILYVQFVSVAKHLHSMLPSSELVYGDVSLNRRSEIFKDFKDGKFKILIAQPRVASHGLNLQFCRCIIFFSPILGNSYYRQAIGRIRRSGQKYKQIIINFYSSKVEKSLYKTLETKEISSQLLLDLYKK